MKLRWEKSCGGSWSAYSGNLLIGSVGKNSYVTPDGEVVDYYFQAINMDFVGKARGDVSSISAGKRAIERGWRQWLTAAGLVHPLRDSWHTFRQSVNPSQACVTFTFDTTKELDRALNGLGLAAGWTEAD